MNPKPSPNPIEHSVRQAMATPDASPAFVEQLQAQIYARAAAQYHPNGRQLAFRTALWLAGVVVLAAAFALLLTPQGRVLAQSLLQFFTQASGDTRALPTAQAPVLVAITPGNERPTPVAEESHPAFFAQCGDLPAPRCSLDEIRRLAQFEVKGLDPTQPGLHFIGASGAPDTVFLVYGRADDPGLLVLYEMPRSQPFPPLEVGANAVVEKVQVGSADGEYVNGFWIRADQDQKETWQEDAGAQTLRWGDGQLFYQLSLFGPAEGTQLGKNDLVALAENLSATSPLVTPDPDHLLSLQAARTVADFEVVEPANIPADYQFDFARAVKDGACLIYQNLKYPGFFQLYISASQGAPLPELRSALGETVPLAQQTVPIAGAKGGEGQYVYANGPAISRLCEPDGQGMAATALFFSARGIQYEIYGPEPQVLTRQEMIAIAEGITGVAETNPQPDLQRLPSIEAAQQAAQFPLKQLTRLPENTTFEYATLEKEMVTLHYSGGIRLMETLAGDKDLDASVAGKPATVVRVGDQEGRYIQGCQMSTGSAPLAWDESCPEVGLIWLSENTEYQLWAAFDPAFAQQILLEMAQSLK